MPIKWYGNGDSEDPIYKHFSRIVNFVIHCMIFTAILSGTWLLKEIKYEIAYFNNFLYANITANTIINAAIPWLPKLLSNLTKFSVT